MKIAWTIAGSDSGGGAGIQADLKTFNQLGVHGCTVVAGLTAQNTKAVQMVAYPSLEMISAQLEALAEDMPAAAIKTGMLGRAEVIDLVADFLEGFDGPVICDPVMVATSGGALMEPDAKKALVSRLLPKVAMVTPNLAEAAVLAEMNVDSPEAMVTAAGKILSLGPKSVLIKGGHGEGDFAQDYWTDGLHSFWLTNRRIHQNQTHGSGCTLSAAIAALMALGYDTEDVLVIAKAYIRQAIRLSQRVGAGAGPVVQRGWPVHPGDLPWLTGQAAEGRQRLQFPDTGKDRLGFYPIVDRLEWMKRLLPLGVKTIQLRIKDMDQALLEREIAGAAALAKAHDVRLFVNDHWELALKYGAYGVHLGQEDLQSADLHRLAHAGTRLGVSTHCYGEVARALALQPSYMAIGPIFPTDTKVMRFGPQGLAALQRWRVSLPYPLVAIGGIKLDRAAEVLAAGADSIAVITAISEAEDPEAETRRWLALFE